MCSSNHHVEERIKAWVPEMSIQWSLMSWADVCSFTFRWRIFLSYSEIPIVGEEWQIKACSRPLWPFSMYKFICTLTHVLWQGTSYFFNLIQKVQGFALHTFNHMQNLYNRYRYMYLIIGRTVVLTKPVTLRPTSSKGVHCLCKTWIYELRKEFSTDFNFLWKNYIF